MYQGKYAKKQELRTKQFRCLDNGHRFPEQVSSWVQYIEEVASPALRAYKRRRCEVPVPKLRLPSRTCGELTSCSPGPRRLMYTRRCRELGQT